MTEARLHMHILDSLKHPVVFVDNDHIIRYLNKSATKHYSEKWGDIMGKSIFHCHNERSCEIMREVYSEMQQGAEEKMITDNKRHRVYMRAVRDESGNLLGYMERFEPPRQQQDE